MESILNNDNRKPQIAVVDDMVGNLKIVGKILLSAGYEAALIQDSQKALAMIENDPPDLILLDIMMPVVNGYQLCEQIKKNEKLKDIPVIFFTAKGEAEDLAKGFEVGGVDYIIKPATKEEVLARVTSHLELKRSRDKILEQKKALEKLFFDRSKFIEIATKNIIEPLERIVEKSVYLKKMRQSLSDMEIDSQLDWIINDSKFSKQTISDIYDASRLDSPDENEQDNIVSFSVDDLIKDVLIDYDFDIKRKRHIVKVNPSDDEEETQLLDDLKIDRSVIQSDKKKVRQIIDNYISNAVKYSPFYKTIVIKTQEKVKNDKEYLLLTVSDQGPGIDSKAQKELFKKYVKLDIPTTGGEPSSGLGLYIAKRLSEMIGAEVGVISEVGKGSTFWALFPKKIDSIIRPTSNI